MGKRPVHLGEASNSTGELYKRPCLKDGETIDIPSGLYVLTERVRESLDRIELCVMGAVPVLLEGPSGSGKSTLLEAFSYLHGRKTVVLNVGEQSDPRTLLGTYTVTANGQFQWKAGVLTTAVREGNWVIIEDVHLASPEYTAILRPLVESRRVMTNLGDINAHPEFRLFATSLIGGTTSLRSHFMCISRDELDEDEQDRILQLKFTQLGIDTIHLVQSIFKRVLCLSNHFSISASIRNLIRLCNRIKVAVLARDDRGLDLELRQFIFLEAADCFSGHLPHSLRIQAMKSLMDLLCLTEEDLSNLVKFRNPSIIMQEGVGKEEGMRVKIGRVSFENLNISMTCNTNHSTLAPTMLSQQVLEKVAVSVKMNEPVLLVGETGTGKTTMIQHLAGILGQPQLIVLNLSQQTEASDLLGGFRPVSLAVSARSAVETFERLFSRTFSRTKNTVYLTEVTAAFQAKNWERLVRLMLQVLDLAKKKPHLNEEWTQFEVKVARLYTQYRAGSDSAAFFAFLEGALVKALENGFWILLDEINLATSETLEILSGLLLYPTASVLLGERGDQRPVPRHPNFRLFACMNPATDAGKKSLPPGIRAKFAEFYVDETDAVRDDLRLVVGHCLKDVHGMTPVARETVLDVYYAWRKAISENRIVDGSRKVPLLNLRTLSRALRFARNTESLYGPGRALYEGLSMSFLTTLDEQSLAHATLTLVTILHKADLLPSATLLPPIKLSSMVLQKWATVPSMVVEGSYIVPLGPEEPTSEASLGSRFVLTPSVRRNVSALARAIMASGHPILLEGPTSAGKTSVIEFLALLTGHRFVRINNHEHTDIQEYIGAYQPGPDGRLQFKEGLLVEALRRGYWLVLDELNLAPSDVLEALNRLLDDNRELYVPELGEVVRPHSAFLLFATQNPAGVYGGRKVLSRAFRSRFIELQFNDLPTEEIEVILSRRCQIAPSQAKKVSKVYAELQQRRTGSNLFAGRHSLVTLRDLFRWAGRPMVTVEDFVMQGYAVLAERLRHEEEKAFVKETIESVFRTKIDLDTLYGVEKGIRSQPVTTWTKPMQRLYSLISKAISNQEPILLVGETGCGKTTVCQVLATLLQRNLIILNCHQNTETADFLGSLRPARSQEDQPTFAWQDGPLITAMRKGSILLVDEISLADDSVLERLNSVLEPGRSLTLAEAIAGEHVIAHKDFILIATMNPGGDYGKKELSPALRNRFTEIWVPSIGDADDLCLILTERLKDKELSEKMVQFVEWWKERIRLCPALRRWPFSIRDVLSWATFISKLGRENHNIVQAAAALFIDPARSIASTLDDQVEDFLNDCREKLEFFFGTVVLDFSKIPLTEPSQLYSSDGRHFGAGPFSVLVSDDPFCTPSINGFCFDSPTTLASLQRVLRAMRLGRSILLEGSPGVGKTSLISALASATGHELVRINLSEQTDLLDLFGSDMPQGNTFTWIDGPFLRAMKKGAWILLDELNLASQSVLEGLNACLDHRGQVYLPELDRTFTVSSATRIFGAQNPIRQGGGRKGLPKSFLNRFVTVWIDPLGNDDMEVILRQKAPSIPEIVLGKTIQFMYHVQNASRQRIFGLQGSPWEFNLRDLFRWVELVLAHPELNPESFLRPIFVTRLRTEKDREFMRNLLKEYFCTDSLGDEPVEWSVQGGNLRVGTMSLNLSRAILPTPYELLPSQTPALEALIACVERGWLALLHGLGQTSLVRFLAALYGVPLLEVALSADSDTADLLGTFDQTSVDEEIQRIAEEASRLLGRVIKDTCDLQDVLSSEAKLGTLLEKYSALKDQSGQLVFEWKDGPLVRALEAGHWILLEQANQCPPAVLDRLNSLFEPQGVLTLSEAATAEPRIIHPHENFRVFMTCSGPGEMSRAMRNRGVEICITPPSQCGILEDLGLIRATGQVGNKMAMEILQRATSHHDLSRLGTLLCQSLKDPGTLQIFLDRFPVLRHINPDELPDPVTFWLKADMKVFGKDPQNHALTMMNYVLENFKFNNPKGIEILKSLWLPSGDCTKLVIVNKQGQLVDKKGRVLSIVEDQIGLLKLLTLTQGWKSMWKRVLSPLSHGKGTLLKMVEALPVATSLFTVVRQLLRQHARLSDSQATIVMPTLSLPIPLSKESIHGLPDYQAVISELGNQVLGELCAFIKRVVTIEQSSSLDITSRMAYSIAIFDSSLDLDRIISNTLSYLWNIRKSLTVAQTEAEGTLRALLVSNSVVIPRVKFLLPQVISDLVAAELSLANDLAKLVGIPSLSKSPQGGAQDLAKAGIIQFRALLSLFNSGDPLQFYGEKKVRLETITTVNHELIQIQMTLRAQLFGDMVPPQTFETLMTAQKTKLQKLIDTVGTFDPEQIEQRKVLIGRAKEYITINGFLSPEGSVERWLRGDGGSLEILLDSVKAVRERLALNLGYDLVLPLLHALDTISLGLELKGLEMNQSNSGNKVSSKSSSLALVVNGSYRSAEASPVNLRLYLAYCQAERALGHFPIMSPGLVSDLRRLYEIEVQRKLSLEEDKSSKTVFDGADEEIRENKIVEELFSSMETQSLNLDEESIIELMSCFDKIYSKGDFENVNTSLGHLAWTLEEKSFRVLIERAWRYSKDPIGGGITIIKKRINIYRENDPLETAELMGALRKFSLQVQTLLIEYPEHDVLQGLILQCNRIAQLSSSSPLVTLLISVETLLQRAQVWQNLTDRAHSLASTLEGLASLVIQWRRRELDGWRQVLDDVDEGYRRGAISKLLWLFQVISITEEEGDYQSLEGLVSLLDTFLLAAPLGELRFRLELLGNAANYPLCNVKVAPVLRLVANYYSTVIETRLQEGIRSHRTTVAENLKAALIETVWRDKTYWAMRQTVEKSHRLIAKQVRSYRDLLDRPVSIILSKQAKPLSLFSFKVDKVDLEKFAAPFCLPSFATKISDHRVKRAYDRLKLVIDRVEKVLVGPGLDSLATFLFEHLEALSQLKSQNATQTKQQALVEGLGTLRGLGIKLYSSFSPEEAAVSRLLAKATAYTFPTSKADEYFLKALASWQTIQSVHMVHEDLGVRQVEACRLAVFRLIETAVNQRGLLGSTSKLEETLGRLVKEMEHRAGLEMAVPVDSKSMVSLVDSMEKILLLAKQSRELLRPHLQFESDHSIIGLERELESLIELLEGTIKDIPKTTISNIGWIDEGMLESLNARIEKILEFDNSHVGVTVIDFIDNLKGHLRLLKTLKRAFLSHDEYPEAVTPWLLLVQTIEESITSESIIDSMMKSRDEHGLYGGIMYESSQSSIKWGLPNFCQKAIELARSLLEATLTKEQLMITTGLALNVSETVKAIVARLRQQHRATAKLALVSSGVVKTLFEKGFCRPKEATTEESPQPNGGESRLEDGTGMADGTGERNVSGEIEFEEQITDLMQPPADSDGEREEQEKEEGSNVMPEQDQIQMREDFNATAKEDEEKNKDGKENAQEEEDDDEQDDTIQDEMGETGIDAETQQLDDGWDESESEKEDKEPDDDDSLAEPKKENDNETIEMESPPPAQSSNSEKNDKDDKTGKDIDDNPNVKEEGEKELDAIDDKDKSPEQNNDMDKDKDDDVIPEPNNPSKSLEEEEEEEETFSQQGQSSMDDECEDALDKSDDDKEKEGSSNEDQMSEAEKSDDTDGFTLAKDHHHQEEKNQNPNQENHGRSKVDKNNYDDDDKASPPNNMPETNKEEENAMMVDQNGSLRETTSAKGPSSKSSQRYNSTLPIPTVIDLAIEKLQKSLHEILGRDSSKEKDEPVEPDESNNSEQLFKETDQGETFATGIATRHGDKDVSKVALEEKDEESIDDEMVVEVEEENLKGDQMLLDSIGMNPTGAAYNQEQNDPSNNNPQLLAPPEPYLLPSWDKVESDTLDLAMELCEQLRLVLEPTKATKLRGDYRTGKRLSLRKIPAYIASHYRRDKIWLRRTKPSARTYRIAISVDNSRSMRTGAGIVAIEALATTASALSRLEAGMIAVNAFGQQANCLHPFEQPWSTDAGRSLLPSLTFDEESTNVAALLTHVNDTLPDFSGSNWQLHLILSDGICHDHSTLRALVNDGLARRIIHVFILLDPKIADINHVNYLPGGVIRMTRYLETFPFQFYVVLGDLRMLPTVLSDAIRQWFEATSEKL